MSLTFPLRFCSRLLPWTASSMKRRGMTFVSPDAGKTTVKHVPMSYTSVESTIPSAISNDCPIVIMHALMGSKGHWNSVTKALHAKTKRKVFAVDARNHGDSVHVSEMSVTHLVEDIRGFLTDNKIEKAVMIGHEMGGQAAMVTAMIYPDLVEKLVVVDTSPVSTLANLYMMPRYFAGIDKLVLRPDITLSVARKSADRQLQMAIPDKELRRVFLTNLVHASNSTFKWRVNLTAIARNCMTVTSFPSMYNKETCAKPTLFLCADAGCVKHAEYADIRRLFPKATFERVGKIGNYIHMRKQNVFLKLVTDFLEKK